MDKEAQGTKNKRLKAVHSGHRGVITKWIRENNCLNYRGEVSSRFHSETIDHEGGASRKPRQ